MPGTAELITPQNNTIPNITTDDHNYFGTYILSNGNFKEAMFGNRFLQNEELENVFFCLDQDGKLKHAWGIGDDHKQYTEAFMNNRLFIRDRNSMLRQVQYTDMTYDVSKAYSDLSEMPQPQKPGLFKQIIHFFFPAAFADEFAEYESELAPYNSMNDDLAKDCCDVARGLEPRSGNPAPEDPRPQRAWKPMENIEVIEEEEFIPEDETLEQFEARLTEYADYSGSVSMKKPVTAGSLAEGMTNRARRAAALEVLHAIEENPEQKTQILAHAKEHFDEMIEDIRDFAHKTIDPADVAFLNQRHPMARNAKGEVMGLKIHFIGETLLENYQSYVNAGKTDNFQQRRYLTPDEQAKFAKTGELGLNRYCDPLGVVKENQLQIDNNNAEIQQQAPAPGMN